MHKTMPIIACLLLSACMKVGPDYRDPKQKVEKNWLHSFSKKTSPKEARNRHASWWKIFHDPTLNRLIQRGYHDNLTLQTAGVHVLQARAQLAQSVGSLYPQQQGATGNYTYNRIGGSSLQAILPPSFQTASLGFTANWELDFWGKYRRAIESNDASFLASVSAYDNALVTLTADIASTYVNIRTNESLIKVTRENIRVQSKSLAIAKSRYNAGQTSLLDVEQAKAQLAQTQAKLPGFVASLQIAKDKMAVLLGTVPSQVDGLLNHNRGIPKAPRQIEMGIPCEVLAQRPDVAEARYQAMAQSASIGAIKANLYPAFSLSGTFSFAANDIGASSINDIFRWSNRTITAGPSFAWSILNYGQITNAVRMQDAAFQSSLLQYQNTVLKAQQEVQDFISQYRQSKNAVQALNRANNASIQSARLALIRYKEGEATYTTVLDAQQQQLTAQTSLTSSLGDVSQAVVGLFRSLGGGWQLRIGHDVIPYRLKREMAQRTGWGVLLAAQNHLPPVTNKQKFEQLYLPIW